MASTRRSPRPLENNVSPTQNKRFKPNMSPEQPVSSPAGEDVDVEEEDENDGNYDEEAVVVDFVGGDLLEEVVVSADDGHLEHNSEVTTTEFDPLVPSATESVPGGSIVEGGSQDISSQEKPGTTFPFKDPNFVHSSKGSGGNKKTRVWKNLKQIVAAERALPWEPDQITYGSIDAPPSFKPAKKYSDISGLEARYTDPQTKMRYSNADEYQRVRILPSDVITGCLQLRKANMLVH